MIVQPGGGLDIEAVGETVVGEVGLPAFVGLFGGEPVVGGLRLLLRGRDDPAVGGQDPGDRRPRGRGHPGLLQVPVDGLGAGVMPTGDEPVAFGQDRRHGLLAGRVRGGVRSAGPGLERGLTLDPPPG